MRRQLYYEVVVKLVSIMTVAVAIRDIPLEGELTRLDWGFPQVSWTRIAFQSRNINP